MDNKAQFGLLTSSIVLSFVFAVFASQFLVSFHFDFDFFYLTHAVKAMLFLAILFYLSFFVHGDINLIFKKEKVEWPLLALLGFAAIQSFTQFYLADAEISQTISLYSSPVYLLFGLYIYNLRGFRFDLTMLPLWLLVVIVMGFCLYSLSWNVNFYAFESKSLAFHSILIAISSMLLTISLRLFYEHYEKGYQLNLLPMVLAFSLISELYGREGFVLWWSTALFNVFIITLALLAIYSLNESTRRMLNVYRRGLDEVTNVYCSGRSDGGVIFVNQAFRNMFNISPDVKVEQIQHPFSDHPLWPEMLNQCETKGSWRGETVLSNNKGKVISVAVVMTQLEQQANWHQISIIDKQDTVELKRKRDDAQEKLERLSFNLMENQEEERRYFAKELHDEIGQGLTLLKIQQQLPEPDTQLIKNVLSELIDKVRNMSLNLRPAILDDMGLSPALTWLADRQAKFSQLQITTRVTDNLPRFDDRLEISVFRIAQEAFTNIHKYSHASHAELVCELDEEHLLLTISDNGVGFDVEAKFNNAIQSQSLGLVSIKERAHLISGDITIQSSPEVGTKIMLKVPLNQEGKIYG